jgi:RPA family protein
MFMRRSTAAKVSIRDITEGKPITGEDGRVLAVETHIGKIGRVNVVATVIDRFEGTSENEEQESGGFATITLDDGTGVIRVKMWGELSRKLAQIKVGDLVLVIGKIRSFQDETYLNGEVIRRLEDKNWETVRLLELAQSQIDPHAIKSHFEASIVEPSTEREETAPSRQEKLAPAKWHTAEEAMEEEEKEEPTISAEVRRIVMLTIEKFDNTGGASFEQIIEATGDATEEEIEQVLIDLLSEGLVYEPEIHRYKKS